MLRIKNINSYSKIVHFLENSMKFRRIDILLTYVLLQETSIYLLQL